MDAKRQGTRLAGLESKTRMVTLSLTKLKPQKDNNYIVYNLYKNYMDVYVYIIKYEFK